MSLDDTFPQDMVFPTISPFQDSPFGEESIFNKKFDDNQQVEKYLRDILLLMQKNGISQFYYTHLPVNNANTGILFYGKIEQGRLTMSIVPTRLSINNEKFVYEVLVDKTDFKITTHSKGNLLLKGENTKWKLISTGNNFESLPFETNNYIERISSNNLTLNYQELIQIYEEMIAKKEHLAIGNKENRIKELSKVIQKQLENPFYQTVKLCVYIKQVDAKGDVIGENLLKTDYKTKECEVRLNITIKPGEKIEIKHVVHPNFLKEYEDKWKKEAKARGLDVDISQMRKESNEEFEKKETEYNFYQKFIQQSKALFNDKIGGYVEAIQATQKVAKNVWAEGTVYKSNWHSKDDDHREWPSYMQFEPVVGGVTDGAIDEIIGIKMAITTVYDIATDEEKRKAFTQVFTSEGMKQMYEGLKQEAEEIYKDSERSEHFVGQTTIAVGSIFLGTGMFSKLGKLGEVTETVGEAVGTLTNPKVVNVLQEIRKSDLHKPEIFHAVQEFLEKLDPKVLDALADAPGFDKALKEMSQQWSKFHGGKFVVDYASERVGKGKTIKFEVETLDRVRRYDIQFEEFLPDGTPLIQNLELKNWTGFWGESIKSQFTKDLGKMNDLGDTRWIFNKKGVNQSMDELRENVIKNLKKADGSPIDELSELFNETSIRDKILNTFGESINSPIKLIDELNKPDIFKQIFEIVE